MERDEYLALRSVYEPPKPRLIVVAESPPLSGKYFYDPSGKVTEPLFAALMDQVGIKPTLKELGLSRLKDEGWLLVDATYEPVNGYKATQKKLVIKRDYHKLLSDLTRVNPDRATPLILIKVNVCRLLKEPLKKDGFIILNCDQAVPFPSNGQQGRFRSLFSVLINKAKLTPQ